MGIRVDYDLAKNILAEIFRQAEEDFQGGAPVSVTGTIANASKILFSSNTQAFREALIGCALARIIDPVINIRQPYMKQGEAAFNGRTLDEKVVNPFLQDQEIPCSTGPYLSALRRNIQFVPETAKGLRDKEAYAAFLGFVEELQNVENPTARCYLRYLLYGFVQLRDAADITLSRIRRLSLEQYENLIGWVLGVPSGGLMPVMLAVAMFETIRQCFELDWEIAWQGINVADRASGVGGDVTIKRAGAVVLAVEITERPIDRARVISTFNTKISPQGIDDYLFFFAADVPSDSARDAARQYFAQGHEINFLPVKDWLVSLLGTIGPKCRAIFTNEFLRLLDSRDVPATLKVAWNGKIKALLG